MVNLISNNSLLVDKLASSLDKDMGNYLKCDFKTIATEFLSRDRAIEQIKLFESEISKITRENFKSKKLLEIGSGAGTFVVVARNDFGIEAFGIEPSLNEFSSFNEITSCLLRENNLPDSVIVNSSAEKLPFEENTFDLVYSTNVLEHVGDPEKVLSESLRVLKKGGFLQFVIPNYFSF